MKNLLLIILFSISISVNAQWVGAVFDTLTHNTVRDEVNQGSMDIESSGIIHVVYTRENAGSGWNIFHKKRYTNTSWSQEESVGDTIGFVPVIVASNVSGQAYIAYESPFSGFEQIFVCSDSTGFWNCQQLTFDSTNNTSPSIAIDGSGFIHLAWIGIDAVGDYKIKYANNMNGIWNSQLLTNSELGMFGSGAAPQIGVDQMGNAHICFRGDYGFGYRIHHAYNDSPNSSNWNYEIVITPNDEDMASSIVVDKDTVVHLLVSGDDGFGTDVEAFYQTRPFSDTAFNQPDAAASLYRGGVGDLFIDHDGQAHVVLNEINGNFYTGNIIYANPNTWNGIILHNTGDLYNANLVLDEQDNAYLLAYQGNTFPDEEVVFYGADSINTSINVVEKNNPYRLFTSENSLQISFNENFSGRLSCTSVDGKIIFDEKRNFLRGESFSIGDLATGVYVFSSENMEKKFATKIQVM
jgi:hypothetical protein